MWEENLKIFDQLVQAAGFERKGKTMAYTSDNGHMFSLFNKDGEIGIRLPKDVGERFMLEHQTTRFRSHGAFMTGYVLIPESLHKDIPLLVSLLKEAHAYIMTLPPK